MLMDCRYLLEKLSSPQVGHIFREANIVADKLACYEKGRDPEMGRNVVFFVYPPPFIFNELKEDLYGTWTIRPVAVT